MFGYIVINKAQLTKKDYETYQAIYCGMCRALHKNHQRRGQLALTYDLCFLAVLLSALYEEEEFFHTERCIVHPLRKCKKNDSACIDYAAQMSIVLTYLKCDDDYLDERKYSKLIYKKLLHKQYSKIRRAYPEKIDEIENALRAIHDMEIKKDYDLDGLSKAFGKVMGNICVMVHDEWEKHLFILGDYLGRFIYLLDAYDDIEEDQKKNLFNPLIPLYQEDNFDNQMQGILEMMMARCADAFEVLPLVKHQDILKNIIYSGVWTRYLQIQKRRQGERHE